MNVKNDPWYTQAEITRIVNRDRAKPLTQMTVWRWCVYGVHGVILFSKIEGWNRLVRLSDVERFFAEVQMARNKKRQKARRRTIAAA